MAISADHTGFTAAFLIMLFPRPLTARQVVRRGLAKNIAATSDLFVQILGAIEEESEGADSSVKIDQVARLDKIRKPFLKISVSLDDRLRGSRPNIAGSCAACPRANGICIVSRFHGVGVVTDGTGPSLASS